MLAWMDAEALAATLDDRRRPLPLALARPPLAQGRDERQRACGSSTWPLDCDARRPAASRSIPVGPTCHRGTRSCFDPEGAPAGRGRPRGSPGSRRSGRRSPIARGRTARGLLHRRPPRWRRRRRRPEGHRGGDRGPDRGQGRRRGRGVRDGPARPRARRSPARPPTSCTTPSCCWPSAACRLPTSSRPSGRGGRPVPPDRHVVRLDDRRTQRLGERGRRRDRRRCNGRRERERRGPGGPRLAYRDPGVSPRWSSP